MFMFVICEELKSIFDKFFYVNDVINYLISVIQVWLQSANFVMHFHKGEIN
jgi:hypothetical protein